LLLKDANFSYPTLKKHERFEEINGLLINHTGRGVGKSAGKN
jgi:hypothetical protein